MPHSTPSLVLDDPLLQVEAPFSTGSTRTGLTPFALVIGASLSFAVFSVLHSGREEEESAVSMTSFRMVPVQRHPIFPRIPEARLATRLKSPLKPLPSIALAAQSVDSVSEGIANLQTDGPAGAKGGAMDPSLACQYSSCVGGRALVSRILADGKELIGQTVTVCGWLKTKRDAGKGDFMFLEVNDGSCLSNLQVVVDSTVKGYESVTNAGGTGSSVRCTGLVVENQGSKQDVELLLNATLNPSAEVELFGGIDDPRTYALAKARQSPETLREVGHLRPRSNLIGAVARARSSLAMATHEFFKSKGFLYVHTPLITASDCEGAGEMFQVTNLLSDEKEVPRLKNSSKIDYSEDFFGKPSFLTVSGQLSVEPYACALSSVYTFGPTFRAEQSLTTRHLAEFWMIEPELAFADLNDDMQCAEDYLKACVSYLMEHNMEDLEFFDLRIEKGLIERLKGLLKEPFARLSYTDAIEALKKDVKEANFEFPVEWGIDLQSEHERWIVEKVTKKPTFVYNYPKDIKAFYMRLNDDQKTVAAMDLLVPRIGELIGGSQREERLNVLDQRIAEMKLDPEGYWWYRDLRRYGSVPHSGFGLGFERLIMLCTGVQNIRDVIPYPRYPKHNNF